MVILGGLLFLMSEVPLYGALGTCSRDGGLAALQGYLGHQFSAALQGNRRTLGVCAGAPRS